MKFLWRHSKFSRVPSYLLFLDSSTIVSTSLSDDMVRIDREQKAIDSRCGLSVEIRSNPNLYCQHNLIRSWDTWRNVSWWAWERREGITSDEGMTTVLNTLIHVRNYRQLVSKDWSNDIYRASYLCINRLQISSKHINTSTQATATEWGILLRMFTCWVLSFREVTGSRGSLCH